MAIERIKNYEKLRAEFEDAVILNIKRGGAKSMLGFLSEKTDFYSAPASMRQHLDKIGGLVLHSLNVWRAMKRLHDLYGGGPLESFAVSALFHDLCKTNFYAKEMKWRKPNEKWVQQEEWAIKDQFPLGHGEKSISILQDHMRTTEEERLAIRWHMAWSDPGVHFYFGSNSWREALKKCAVLKALVIADIEATFFIDEGGGDLSGD